MEKLKEKLKMFVGSQNYRSLMLIPGTTSYRDIEQEDDVTTSCAQAMTSSFNSDVRFDVREIDKNVVESIQQQTVQIFR